MKARDAVAWAPKKPLEIEEIEVMGSREGEVLLKVIASGVFHTSIRRINTLFANVQPYPFLPNHLKLK